MRVVTWYNSLFTACSYEYNWYNLSVKFLRFLGGVGVWGEEQSPYIPAPPLGRKGEGRFSKRDVRTYLCNSLEGNNLELVFMSLTIETIGRQRTHLVEHLMCFTTTQLHSHEHEQHLHMHKFLLRKASLEMTPL